MDTLPVVNTLPVVAAGATAAIPSGTAAWTGAEPSLAGTVEGATPFAVALTRILDVELKSLLEPDTDLPASGTAEIVADPGTLIPQAPAEVRADPFAAMLLAPIMGPATDRGEPVTDIQASVTDAPALPVVPRTPGVPDLPAVDRDGREDRFDQEAHPAAAAAREHAPPSSDPIRAILPALTAVTRSDATPEATAEASAPIAHGAHALRVVVEPRAEPPASVPQVRIEPEVGTSGFREMLGEKMVFLVGRETHTAELHLNPPNLGPLEIRLTVSAEGTDALFFSAQSEVRQAVELALPRLREIMAENGIALGQASVSDRQPQPESHAHPGAHRGSGQAATPDDAGTPVETAPSIRTVAYGIAGSRLVDTFA